MKLTINELKEYREMLWRMYNLSIDFIHTADIKGYQSIQDKINSEIKKVNNLIND